MNYNSSNEAEYFNISQNLNTNLAENSIKHSNDDQNCIASDNFWEFDPFVFGDPYKSCDEIINHDNTQTQLINTQTSWLTENENHNYSINSSNTCQNQDETSFNPSISLLKDQNEIKHKIKKPNKKFYRKLPIHFIDSKDWESYMELATIRNASMNNGLTFGMINNGIPKTGKFKNNKVQRLLNSIYNLYQDYSELSEEYEKLNNQLNSKYISADSVSSDEGGYLTNNDPCFQISKKKNHKFKHKFLPMSMPDTHCEIPDSIDLNSSQNSIHETNSVSSQTSPIVEWSELSENQLADFVNNSDTLTTNNNTNKWNIQPISNSKKNISTLFDTSVNISKTKRIKIFDHLTRQNFLGEQAIDIMEELICNRIILHHKMNLITCSNNNRGANNSPDEIQSNDFLNHPNFIFSSIATALRCTSSKSGNNSASNNTLVNLPIIMDLMLPKMQIKIRQIFEECSFLNNPLEIMAELRHFNYNKNSTIEHFKNTRQLRGIIKEFINNNIDSRCRLVVLRCLYRNYHSNNDKEAMFSCSNCGKDFFGNGDNFKSNLNNEKVLFPDDDRNYFKQHDDNIDCFNSLRMTTEEVGKVTVITNSKSTCIENGIFDNAVQDSFSQTQHGDNNKVNGVNIKSFAEGVIRNVSFLKNSIKESKIQIVHLRRQVSSLLKALKNNIDLIISLSSKHFMSDQHRNRIIQLARQVEELKLKLKEEETKRRIVYNLMQEQMGNVRVYCRCRDIPHNENVLEIQGNESIVLPILPQEKFDFDKVFPSNMSQNDIYEEFRPLVMSFIDGFNVCFITYGSEASGKTYTLIGGNMENMEEHGIMQRALTTLLTEQTLRSRDWDYQITACLVEIYNDNCIDILSGECGIQLYVDCGMESVYQKLKSVPITNKNDTESLLQLCRIKRKIAKTALNPASSRSHLITLIRLQGKSKIHGENIRSFMCLCDLAGFEDIIKAETQSNKTLSKEAGYINKSLTAFNRVFVSLRRQDPNTVCYRDTKLTHFLKPFLTNSGKCALVITIRTDRRSLSSTQNTLRFGRETRGVSLGKARRQVNINQH